ncbi:peptidoglycan-binding protein [Streptomyces sp. NPDC054871]
MDGASTPRFGLVSSEATVPDPSTYPAFSSYLTQTSSRRPHKAVGVSRPVDGPTYTTPSSLAPSHPRQGRHRAAAGMPRQRRSPTRSRPVAARPRRGTPRSFYGYASAALLALTAALLAQAHDPVSPQAGPAQQPDAPSRPSPPVHDEAASRPDPPGKSTPQPSSTANTNAPPRSRPSAGSASSVLRFGSTGSSVRQLQERLRQLRLYTGPLDGYYSHDVAAAVARMQQARAIPEPLGVYGPDTRTAIRTAATNPDITRHSF